MTEDVFRVIAEMMTRAAPEAIMRMGPTLDMVCFVILGFWRLTLIRSRFGTITPYGA